MISFAKVMQVGNLIFFYYFNENLIFFKSTSKKLTGTLVLLFKFYCIWVSMRTAICQQWVHSASKLFAVAVSTAASRFVCLRFSRFNQRNPAAPLNGSARSNRNEWLRHALFPFQLQSKQIALYNFIKP